MNTNLEAFWTAVVAAELQGNTSPILIDVRSEGEFESDGHWLSVNIPILNNEERHKIGIEYKTNGTAAAVALGHVLVSGERRRQRIEAWKQAVAAGATYLTCWRGGLRSKTAESWIEDEGLKIKRIEGGTKALRRRCISTIESSARTDIDFIVHGRTGSGKTSLLQSLGRPFGFVDLEKCANHRGSSFGYDLFRPQPSQIQFENRLAIHLAAQRTSDIEVSLIEGESRMIGRSVIPLSFFELMSSLPVILVKSEIDDRVTEIYRDYIEVPLARGLDAARLLRFYWDALDRVKRRLGGAKHLEILNKMNEAFDKMEVNLHRDWIENLLRSYYDRLYDFGSEKYRDRLVFEGTRDQVKLFLKEYALAKRKKNEASLAG